MAELDLRLAELPSGWPGEATVATVIGFTGATFGLLWLIGDLISDAADAGAALLGAHPNPPDPTLPLLTFASGIGVGVASLIAGGVISSRREHERQALLEQRAAIQAQLDSARSSGPAEQSPSQSL